MPVQAFHPGRPALPRGGARNRKDRKSWQLTERDCRKLIGATDAAWHIGAPMTRFLTLAFELGGCTPGECVTLTGKFIALARKWLRERGHPMPWVWVQECGERYGAHAHVLFHVPPELDQLFRPMPRRWAKHLLDGQYRAGVVRCESLHFRKAAYTNPDIYWPQVRGKLHYMLKCAPSEFEGRLGMAGIGYGEWGQRCLVHGKRAGVWQGWQHHVTWQQP